MQDETAVVLGEDEVGARPRIVGVEEELRVGNDERAGRRVRLGRIDVDVRMVEMRSRTFRNKRGVVSASVIQRITKNLVNKYSKIVVQIVLIIWNCIAKPSVACMTSRRKPHLSSSFRLIDEWLRYTLTFFPDLRCIIYGMIEPTMYFWALIGCSLLERASPCIAMQDTAPFSPPIL
jgi:hypothetical protein